MSSLAERLTSVRGLISSECQRLARQEPTLIVVTKNHPVELARELYELGERNFGENRVQEGGPKAADLQKDDLKWHLIGQLQTNKVKQALEFASTLQSLDRDSLLAELTKRTNDREQPLDVFIQVNLTEDNARGGISPSDLDAFAEKVANARGLNLVGLMGVAALDVSPEREFSRMAQLSQQLQKTHPAAVGLSIGMSGDYLEALSYGATHLRIGTAITGNRQY